MRINETVDVSLGELVGPTPIMSKQVKLQLWFFIFKIFFQRWNKSTIKCVSLLKLHSNTFRNYRTVKNRAITCTGNRRRTARRITQRHVCATCTRPSSSPSCRMIRSFTFSTIWRAPEHSTWPRGR